MRKFTDEERRRIRENLLDTGQKLLLTYGPGKTTVKDITEPVGIAKPTFYQFFDAKSELYVEIFDREFEDFVENMYDEIAEVQGPQAKLKRYFECYVEFAEGNEFVQEVFLRRDYRDILGNVPEEKIREVERKQMEAMIPPLQEIKEQSDGPISDMEPVTVLGLMGTALGYMVLHKDEIDEHETEGDQSNGGFYAHIKQTLITTLARGLTVEQ